MASLKGKSISSTYKNILQSENEISNTTLRSVQSGSGNTLSMRLSTDKVEFLKVGIGTGGASPDGLLHIMSTSAGAVTSHSSADEATLESSGASGLSILSGASSSGNIFFGDVNDNDVGKIAYDHSNDSLTIGTSGSNSMVIDKSGNVSITGNLSQSEDRYFLDEYFHSIPYQDIQDTEVTQDTSATNAVTSHTKHVRITTYANDLAANDSQEFTLTNDMIHAKSHVLAVLVDTSATVVDNAMVNVIAYDIANGNCKIRISNGGVDIASMTFTIQVTVDPHIDSNDHWASDGTNVKDTNLRYAGTQPGISFFASGSDNDQVILHPKISSEGNGTDLVNISPWRNVSFFSQYQTELNVAISTSGSIANQGIWAGMKLTTTGLYTTDVDQAYFLYATDDDLGALTTNGNLHFVYSIGGTDYVTDLGITVAINSVYRLKLSFDENRKISVFVNNVQYGLTSTNTGTTAGGVTQSTTTTRSSALTDDIDLLPFIGVQAHTTSSKGIQVGYVKLSRDLYE